MWSPRWASCSTSSEVPGGAAAATSSLLREKAYRHPEPDILIDVLLLVYQRRDAEDSLSRLWCESTLEGILTL